jgi:hypothetical protein
MNKREAAEFLGKTKRTVERYITARGNNGAGGNEGA